MNVVPKYQKNPNARGNWSDMSMSHLEPGESHEVYSPVHCLQSSLQSPNVVVVVETFGTMQLLGLMLDRVQRGNDWFPLTAY